MVEDGDRLRPEACQSPVWDTGLAVLALRACGVPADHPQLVRAGEYLLAQEVHGQGRLGDPHGRTSRPAAGPSSTRTTSTPTPTTRPSSAARAPRHRASATRARSARGLDWLVGMQSRGGGWGAFDVDNQAMWLYKIPFCDFGKVTDEPSADVTAHALETLGTLGVHDDAAERGLEWLLVRAGGGRLLVRALGREPPLRHRRRAAGARGLRHPARPSLRCAAPSPGSTPSSRRAAASARTSAPTPILRGAAARDFTTPSQTAWALLGLRGRRKR